MSDFLDERVREAFVEFRDDVKVEIKPPGAAAVRRSVRGRRVRTAVAGGGVALAFVAGMALLRPTGPASDPGLAGTPSPSTDYATSLQEAVSRLGYAAGASYWSNPGSPFWWTNTLSQPMERTFAYDGARPGSSVWLTAACAGGGSLTVTWSTADASPTDLEVSCDADGTAVSETIPVTYPDMEVLVTVLGDDRVTYTGAFIVAMSDPRSLAAEAALRSDDGSAAVVGTGSTYDQYFEGTSTRNVRPGRYHLTLVCIGTGISQSQIGVRLSLGDDTQQGKAMCTEEGGRLDLEVSSATADELSLRISEYGDGGYAYRLAQVP